MFSLVLYLLLVALLVLWVEGGFIRSTNSLITHHNPGEALEEWLKTFQWGNRSQVSEKLYLPRYKFYSEIIEGLLSLARRMGGNYQEALLFLRDGLQSDQQFEKKMKEARLGCWLQMLLIMVLTWAFVLAALSMVDIRVSWMKLACIGFWQVLGLALLPYLIAHYRNKYFSDIGLLWKMLYVLISLARVPLARSEIFSMAGIQELSKINQKNLAPLVEKLKSTCREALKGGGSYEGEVRYLMEELRFQEKWHFTMFEKRLSVIKLCLLAVFFLPAYLSFIFMLLGDLMTLM